MGASSVHIAGSVGLWYWGAFEPEGSSGKPSGWEMVVAYMTKRPRIPLPHLGAYREEYDYRFIDREFVDALPYELLLQLFVGAAASYDVKLLRDLAARIGRGGIKLEVCEEGLRALGLGTSVVFQAESCRELAGALRAHRQYIEETLRIVHDAAGARLTCVISDRAWASVLFVPNQVIKERQSMYRGQEKLFELPSLVDGVLVAPEMLLAFDEYRHEAGRRPHWYEWMLCLATPEMVVQHDTDLVTYRKVEQFLLESKPEFVRYGSQVDFLDAMFGQKSTFIELAALRKDAISNPDALAKVLVDSPILEGRASFRFGVDLGGREQTYIDDALLPTFGVSEYEFGLGDQSGLILCRARIDFLKGLPQSSVGDLGAARKILQALAPANLLHAAACDLHHQFEGDPYDLLENRVEHRSAAHTLRRCEEMGFAEQLRKAVPAVVLDQIVTLVGEDIRDAGQAEYLMREFGKTGDQLIYQFASAGMYSSLVRSGHRLAPGAGVGLFEGTGRVDAEFLAQIEGIQALADGHLNFWFADSPFPDNSAAEQLWARAKELHSQVGDLSQCNKVLWALTRQRGFDSFLSFIRQEPAIGWAIALDVFGPEPLIPFMDEIPEATQTAMAVVGIGL